MPQCEVCGNEYDKAFEVCARHLGVGGVRDRTSERAA
jgi:hypothetical protein